MACLACASGWWVGFLTPACRLVSIVGHVRVAAGEEVPEARAAHFVLAATGQRGTGAVEADDPALAIDHADQHVRRLKDLLAEVALLAKPLLGVAERFFRPL